MKQRMVWSSRSRAQYQITALLALVVIVFLLCLTKEKENPSILHEKIATPTAANDAQPTTKQHQLRLLSLNIWQTLTSTTGAAKEERIDLLVDYIASIKYDIVLIQELPVFTFGPFLVSSRASQFSAGMAKAGYGFHTSLIDGIPAHGLFGQNAGVCIFSRLPIIKTFQGYFRDWNYNEILNNKGFVAADISVNGYVIRIGSLHLDAGGGNVVLKQTRQALEALRSSSPKEHLVLAGDFNICSKFNPGCKQYDEFLNILHESNLKEVFPGRTGTWREWPMDHVVLDKNDQTVVFQQGTTPFIQSANGLNATDHLGLDVTLSLRD